MKRRAHELDGRRSKLTNQRQALAAERAALTTDNKLRRRINAFAQTVTAAIDNLDFGGRQRLLRLVVEEVHVKGFKVEIQLRIPLDEPPNDPTTSSTTPPNPAGPDNPARRSQRKASGQTAVSSQDRLRSVGDEHNTSVQQPIEHGTGSFVLLRKGAGWTARPVWWR